jgi:hypothetical protein
MHCFVLVGTEVIVVELLQGLCFVRSTRSCLPFYLLEANQSELLLSFFHWIHISGTEHPHALFLLKFLSLFFLSYSERIGF